jgi:hypothetical protein
MQGHIHSLIWRGTPFQFQCFDEPADPDAATDWVVYRAGEFIGWMSFPAGVTGEEFELGCLLWLGELFEPSSA